MCPPIGRHPPPRLPLGFRHAVRHYPVLRGHALAKMEGPTLRGGSVPRDGYGLMCLHHTFGTKRGNYYLRTFPPVSTAPARCWSGAMVKRVRAQGAKVAGAGMGDRTDMLEDLCALYEENRTIMSNLAKRPLKKLLRGGSECCTPSASSNGSLLAVGRRGSGVTRRIQPRQDEIVQNQPRGANWRLRHPMTWRRPQTSRILASPKPQKAGASGLEKR